MYLPARDRTPCSAPTPMNLLSATNTLVEHGRYDQFRLFLVAILLAQPAAGRKRPLPDIDDASIGREANEARVLLIKGVILKRLLHGSAIAGRSW